MSDMVERVREFAENKVAEHKQVEVLEETFGTPDCLKAYRIILTLLDVAESGETFIDKCDVMAPEINDRIVHCELVRKFKPLSQNWSKEHKAFRIALTTAELQINSILEGGSRE